MNRGERLMPGKDDEAGAEPDEGQTFVSLPVPPFPPPAGRDVFFWAATESDSPGGREYEDLMLRRVPGRVAHRFRGAAGARGFTHAQYLAALVALHEAMRQRADGGDEQVAEILKQLGLGTVTI
jgi:hypothetical protein